jgi:cell division protein FtsB
MRIQQILTWVFLVCGVLLVVGILRNSVKTIEAQRRLSESKALVASLEDKQYKLIQGQEKYQSQEYLDKQIRNKLKLVLPGETLVILPEQLKEEEEEALYHLEEEEKVLEREVPIWREWLTLLRF